MSIFSKGCVKFKLPKLCICFVTDIMAKGGNYQMAYVLSHLCVMTDVGFHASEKWHKIHFSFDYGITFYLYQFL